MQANSYLKYNWPSILWAAFVLYLCLMPASQLPHITIPNFDKLVHFTFYFVLAVLMYWGWLKQQSFSWLHKNTWLKILLIASAYGLLIEVLQKTLTTDRHFEWLDEAADAAGAAVGLIASLILNPSPKEKDFNASIK